MVRPGADTALLLGPFLGLLSSRSLLAFYPTAWMDPGGQKQQQRGQPWGDPVSGVAGGRGSLGLPCVAGLEEGLAFLPCLLLPHNAGLTGVRPCHSLSLTPSLPAPRAADDPGERLLAVLQRVGEGQVPRGAAKG